MVSRSASSNHSSFAPSQSEMSLFRSFHAIHRNTVGTSYNEAPQDSQLNGGHNQNIRRLNRRRTIATTQISPTSVKGTATAFLPEELPSLPFTKNAVSPPSQPQRTTKFQRRHFPVTAIMAQEMVTRLASENLYCLRRPVEVGTLEDIRNLGRQDSVTFENSRHRFFDEGPVAEKQHKIFRKNYTLGTIARSPHHMITEPTSDRAAQAAGSLKDHDSAFVKRSDGSFSYATLTHRSEDCLVFVVNATGSTKMIRKNYWSAFVRLVSMEGLDHCPPTTKMETMSRFKSPNNCPPSITQHLEEHSEIITPSVIRQGVENHNDWSPISMIVFDPEMNDECSLISSVSDRARCTTRRGKM